MKRKDLKEKLAWGFIITDLSKARVVEVDWEKNLYYVLESNGRRLSTGRPFDDEKLKTFQAKRYSPSAMVKELESELSKSKDVYQRLHKEGKIKLSRVYDRISLLKQAIAAYRHKAQKDLEEEERKKGKQMLLMEIDDTPVKKEYNNPT